jgi:hypothetical protein
MSRRRRRFTQCLSAVAVASFAGTAAATEFAVPAGNFTAGPSWTGGVAPGPTDPADINNGGTATINAGDNPASARCGSASTPARPARS